MTDSRTTETLRRALKERWEECRPTPFDPAHPRILLHEPTFGEEEIWEALECLLSTRVTMGQRVLRFEREFGTLLGFRHAAMVNSGSSANLLAVAALANPAWPDRLKPGDEVIVPALCWSTTVWPLVQHGLVPVVVDVDPRTFDIDPAEAERAVGPKTRGIMPVHVYGNPCAMDALVDLARRKSLALIEDCCESIGARFGGRHVGTFGRVGTFSFYFSHHITTLEGGMCATSDFELAELIRTLRAHGWVRENEDRERYLRKNPEIHPRFLFVNQGYNLRPTELQGAFGSVQLGKLDAFVRIRTSNAEYWRREFASWEDLFQIQEPTKGGEHSWFGFPMAVKKAARFTAKDLCAHLESRGVETRPLICGNIAAQPGMKYYPYRVVGDLPHTNHLMSSGFTFGNHQMVDARAREYIARAVREFVSR